MLHWSRGREWVGWLMIWRIMFLTILKFLSYTSLFHGITQHMPGLDTLTWRRFQCSRWCLAPLCTSPQGSDDGLLFFNFQYFWTKTFGDSYTSIRQIFSTWQWLPSIWCYYILICKNVQYLNEKPVKVFERSKFTIVNMFSMHINNFFFYFIYFSYSLRTVYFLDCLYLGLLGVGTSLFPPTGYQVSGQWLHMKPSIYSQ